MKFPTYLLASIALAFGLNVSAEVAPPDKLYAFMNNAASWSEGDNYEPYWGFYSFAPDGANGFQAVSPTGYNYNWALTTEGGGGGIYDDGSFYCFSLSGTYYNYTVSFYKVDSRTWLTTASSSKSGNTDNPQLIPVDLTANPVDGKIYAVCRPRYSNSDYGVLVTVNRDNGELTRVAQTGYFYTLSCDADGQLYGIGTDGALYKIALDGKTTKVGDTGLHIFPKEQTSTIDFRTGKMYFSHYGYADDGTGVPNYNAHVKGLYEVDLTTAKATLLHVYADDNNLSALSILNCNPLAPDLVTDLAFAPKSVNSATGVVTYTVPALTYGQNPLTGSVKAAYYVDNTLRVTDNVTPGSKVTKELELAADDDNHTVTLVLTANGFDGVQASATSFFGEDTPDHVNNLTLTASEDVLTATVSWDAPTGSLNGGYYDPANVRYQVVRYPDNVILYRSLKETSFTEEIEGEYSLYYYDVTPYVVGSQKFGNKTRSNKVFLGRPWDMPYAEPFNTESAFNTFTVIDANGDGGEWGWEDPVWKFDNVYYCAFFYDYRSGYANDDWLITPKLNLNDTKLYRLTFQMYGYTEGLYNKIRVCVGPTANVQGMHKEIFTNTSTSTMSSVQTLSCLFAPSAGDLYVGFHNITEDAQHLSIDNILIEEIGLSSVPAAVNNLTATIADRVNGKVNLSMTAPSLDAADKPLTGNMTIAIYRGDDATPFKTFTDIKPGAEVSFVDDEAVQAVNIYRVLPSNDSGTGLENSISIDLRAGVPQQLKNVVATMINDNQVRITWDEPTDIVDENGNEIDTEHIRYLVYRPLGDDEYDIIGRNLTECEFIDNEPRLLSGDSQSSIYYYVAAVNGDGLGVANASNVLYVGTPYQLPFSETWYQQQTASDPWLTTTSFTAGWTYAYKGYSPLTDGQDGPGLLSLEVAYGVEEGQSSYWSPRIDLSTVSTATLEFYIYGENTYKDNDWIRVGVDVEGKGQSITDAFFQPKRWAGWKKCTVDLTPYVGNDRVSLVLIGNIVAQDDERRIHIDNLSVTGTPVESELKITGFDGPGELREGIQGQYTVTVANIGQHDAENLPVQLFVDNELITSTSIAYLSAGESATATLQYAPLDGSDDVLELVAAISPATGADTFVFNNTVSRMLAVRPINIPSVTDLSGEFLPDEQRVNLFWGNPTTSEFVEHVTDGAEAYDAFAIDEVGAWTMYDGDHQLPFRFKDPTSGNVLTWDNNDQLQAWMVFRPADVVSDNTFYPFKGDQMFCSWASFGGASDDWLISPELPGHAQLLSFFVRCLNEADANETYNVLYSTTDTDPASFHRLNGDTPLYATTTWDPVYFSLPEGTKYFAIQYTGNQQSAIMIDEVMYEGYNTHQRLDGYNIYRDGVKLNSTPVSRRNFADTSVPAGKISRYTVCPVFAGIEGDPSNVYAYDPAGVLTPGMNSLSVMSGKGTLHVNGAAGMELYLYSADGKLVMLHNVAADSETLSVAPGIYLAKIGGETFKVIVR